MGRLGVFPRQHAACSPAGRGPWRAGGLRGAQAVPGLQVRRADAELVAQEAPGSATRGGHGAAPAGAARHGSRAAPRAARQRAHGDGRRDRVAPDVPGGPGGTRRPSRAGQARRRRRAVVDGLARCARLGQRASASEPTCSSRSHARRGHSLPRLIGEHRFTTPRREGACRSGRRGGLQGSRRLRRRPRPVGSRSPGVIDPLARPRRGRRAGARRRLGARMRVLRRRGVRRAGRVTRVAGAAGGGMRPRHQQVGARGLDAPGAQVQRTASSVAACLRRSGRPAKRPVSACGRSGASRIVGALATPSRDPVSPRRG